MSARRVWIKSWRKTRRSARERAKRIRILSTELDVLRSAASERSRTIETKASFVVVVAGVLASVTGLSLVTTDTWLIGLLPFGLTIAAVAVATAALWPRKLNVPSGRHVVNTWVDADMTATALEDHILEVKAQEVTKRDNQNEERAKLTKWGFALVLAGLVATLAVVTLNALSPTWRSDDQAKPTPTPVSTQTSATP